VYSPVAAVTVNFAIPVDADVTVTLAPEITAPEWSVTVPTIAVSTVCALLGIEIKANNGKRRIEGNLFIIMNNLLMTLASLFNDLKAPDLTSFVSGPSRKLVSSNVIYPERTRAKRRPSSFIARDFVSLGDDLSTRFSFNERSFHSMKRLTLKSQVSF